MKDSTIWPRIETTGDLRACKEREFVARNQAYLKAKLAELKQSLEAKVRQRAIRRNNSQYTYTAPPPSTRDLRDQIKAVEELLEPASWDMYVDYLANEFRLLPPPVRQRLLDELGIAPILSLPADSDPIPVLTNRLQVRISPQQHKVLLHHCERCGWSVSQVLVATLKAGLANADRFDRLPRVNTGKLSVQIFARVSPELARDLRKAARHAQVTPSDFLRWALHCRLKDARL